MFTDLVGFSALAQRNETLALELLAESQRLLRAQFPNFNGREIKSTGDGFLVEFPSALQATQCALEIQQEIADFNSAQPPERQLRVRIGLHVGEVVHRENDLYGDGVNVAARIEPLAIGGGICLSDTVFAQVRNKLDLRFIKLDSPKLKHIEVPMDVYRVEPPTAAAPAGVARSAPVASLAAWLQTLTPRWLLAAAGLVALAAAIGWLIFPSHGVPAAGISPQSVAVLPFLIQSADKNDEYLSDGMTEELLNVLAKVKNLRVPGRASSFAFKGRSDDNLYRLVGSQLRVANVLEGSVRKAADRLRVNVQLINATNGYEIWSGAYDENMSNISHLLDFQTQVAQEVVQSLAIKLGAQEAQALARKPTANPEANRLYLLGRYYFAKGNFTGFSNSIAYFQQAAELDPNYALAYCGMADAYGFTAGFLWPGKTGWAKEKELAERALKIDPDLAEAHFSLGLALASSFHWQEGEQEMKLAIKNNPNMAVAYDQYAFLLTCLGRHDEAIRASRKAVDLDPLSPLINLNLGWWLMLAHHYDEAIVASRKAMRQDSNLTLAHWALGWSLLWSGDKAGAIPEFETAYRLEPLPFFEAPLGYAYAVAGHRAEAERILADLENPSKGVYTSPGLRVYPALGLGRKDQLYDCLNQSYEAQDYPCHFLKVDPVFDEFRGEPRFQELEKKVGLIP